MKNFSNAMKCTGRMWRVTANLSECVKNDIIVPSVLPFEFGVMDIDVLACLASMLSSEQLSTRSTHYDVAHQ